jgi:hypothetical protein
MKKLNREINAQTKNLFKSLTEKPTPEAIHAEAMKRYNEIIAKPLATYKVERVNGTDIHVCEVLWNPSKSIRSTSKIKAMNAVNTWNLDKKDSPEIKIWKDMLLQTLIDNVGLKMHKAWKEKVNPAFLNLSASHKKNAKNETNEMRKVLRLMRK